MGTTHHSHDHDHNHHHHHDHTQNISQLKKVLLLTLFFMFVEVVGGLYTNSLALISDAGHMLTDVIALGLSMFAFIISSRPPNDKKTYGYHRFEILAAFINGIFLVLIALGIIYGAWLRLRTPLPIKTVEMFWISTVGFLFNVLGAWLLTHGHHHNHNMRGALFHVIGDALGSLGAMIAAILIHYFHWNKADPIVSIIIAIIIIISAFKLLLDTSHVILEGTPLHLDTNEIQKALEKINHVREVHDLHVWSITSGLVSLSVHIVADQCSNHELLCQIRDFLKKEYGIDHVTIQIEEQSLKKDEPHI